MSSKVFVANFNNSNEYNNKLIIKFVDLKTKKLFKS